MEKGSHLQVSENLFTPFFSTKPNEQGLGLTLIREILLNHDAQFFLKAVENGWTEFRIVFNKLIMNKYAFLKNKKNFLFYLFILSFLLPSFGQQDSTLLKSPKGYYPHEQMNTYQGKSRGLAIIPEIHGFKHLTIGLNIADVKSYYNGWLGTKSFFQVGAEYMPQQKTIAPKIKYWKVISMATIGLNAGVNSLYYFKKNTSNFALRPEIGLGFLFFQINYGYTFFFNKQFEGLSPHVFSLSWYHTISHKKKKKKKK